MQPLRELVHPLTDCAPHLSRRTGKSIGTPRPVSTGWRVGVPDEALWNTSGSAAAASLLVQSAVGRTPSPHPQSLTGLGGHMPPH